MGLLLLSFRRQAASLGLAGEPGQPELVEDSLEVCLSSGLGNHADLQPLRHLEAPEATLLAVREFYNRLFHDHDEGAAISLAAERESPASHGL